MSLVSSVFCLHR